MCEFDLKSFRTALLVFSFLLLCAAFASGNVVELTGLDAKWPGKVFLYWGDGLYGGDGAPAASIRPFEAMEDADAIPRRVPGARGLFSSPGRPVFWGKPGASSGSSVGSKRLKLLGRAFDEGGMAVSVAAYGDFCYVGTTGSLRVLDVSDPNAPVPVFELGEAACSLDREGNLLGAVMGYGGELVLLDLSDPAAPSEISRLAPPKDFYFCELSLEGTLAAVTGWGYLEGFGYCFIMQVIDISDPGAPAVKSTMLGLHDVYRGIHMAQTVIYLMVQEEGLVLLDVSDPETIVQKGFLPCYYYVDGMVYENGYLYMSGNGLEVADVSDPSKPELVAQLGGAYTAAIRLSGGIAYLADDDDHSLRIIDVTDPLNPQAITTLQAYGRVYQLDVFGGKAFLADHVYGLLVVDISVPASPTLLSMTATGVLPHCVDVDGDLAAVTGNHALLYTLDVTDPFAPEVLGWHEPVPDAKAGNTLWQLGVDLEGTTAVTSYWSNGVNAYDVTDPALPELAGFFSNKGSGVLNPVAQMGNYLYTGGAQLLVVDMTDPANPVQVGTGPTVQDRLTDIKISGQMGYLSGYTEVVIVDLSNPTAPLELARFDVPQYTKGLAVDNHILGVFWEGLYMPKYLSALELYDISTPSSPQFLSSWDNIDRQSFTRPGGSTVRAVDGRFYICHIEQLSVVDAKDPHHPFLAAIYPDSPCEFWGWPPHEGICTAGGLLYLGGLNGLQVLRFLDVGLFLTPEADPLTVPQGESFTYEMKLENFTSEAQTVRPWTATLFAGGSGGPEAGPVWITLQPGQSVIYARQQAIPATAPPGTYHLDAHLIKQGGVEMDSARITFEVVSSGD